MSLKKILAIDYGEKRIGIALSDALQMTAQGLPNIDNNRYKFDKIKALCENENVAEIIVGIPRRFDGTIGEAAQKIEKFAQQLKKHVNIPVKFWDEWLSTKEAEKHLIHADKSRKKRKGLIDRVAAQLILQGYLDSIKNKF